MAAGTQTVGVGGRRLRVSNLNKVLYPSTSTTKGEVIDYYARIAAVMLPHLRARPVTRKRWPEGVDHPPFFAKHLEAGAPDWLPRRAIDHSSGAKDYPLVEEPAALVYLAQTASLELHVPQWQFTDDGKRRNPDRLVLDLDPGAGVGLAECAEVARWARAILTDLGLDPHPVTSGSKGIHLYAKLDGTRTSEQISAFAKELARALEADHADLVVSQMSKSLRPGRVFVDWSQNNAAKTTISPYSLRGRSEPTVAAPRTWEELDDPQLAQLMLADVLARVEAMGDPLASVMPDGAEALARYLAKRSAARTPEPMPGESSPAHTPGKPRFVIQEHHARRLHYDLRLERDGVLVSWAVPRGIPDSPDANHLAVMTEPHPVEYLTFEGRIPDGEYGAGEMSIWDDGTYEVEKWRDGEVIFTLAGRPDGQLREARLALIRTSGAGEKSQWLLHRMKTDATGPRPTARSIAHRTRRKPSPVADSPMLATASTAAQARAQAERWRRRDEAALADTGPGHEGEASHWAEFKWDGIRAIGTWDGHRLHLRGRSGTDITQRYPELTDLDINWGPRPCVVDGEIVALDESGRPSFTRLQNRMHLSRPHDIAREAARTPAVYFVFDLLSHDGVDAAPLPLRERRQLLELVTTDSVSTIVTPPVSADVDSALSTAKDLALEGVVVKDPRSPYRRGARSEEWLKVKLTQTQDVVIGAIRPGKGGRHGQIGSLLLGIPDEEGRLRYVGRVGTGFTEAALRRLEDLLTPLRTNTNPFVDVPKADASDALWVVPKTVGEVEFAEFTPGGTLRHARWRGIRPDVSASDVSRST